MLNFVLLAFSFWIVPRVNAQEANITIPPRAVNISIGEVAEFNCTGVANDFVWFKNGQPIDNGDGLNIISPTTTVNEQENIRMSTLKITVTSIDNAANITCGALYIDITSQYSITNKTVLLLVQGQLKPVHNLTVVIINSTTALISWIPPFTLEGVPILSYNFTITNTTSGENETMSVEGDTSTMLYYTINHPDPVDNFTVTVFCLNKAGTGDKASMTFLMSVNQIVSTSQENSCYSSAFHISYTQKITQSIFSTITASNSVLPAVQFINISVIIGALVGVIIVGFAAAVFLTVVIILYKHKRKSRDQPITCVSKQTGETHLADENHSQSTSSFIRQLSRQNSKSTYRQTSKTDSEENSSLLEREEKDDENHPHSLSPVMKQRSKPVSRQNSKGTLRQTSKPDSEDLDSLVHNEENATW